jgi:hypothetical protein
MANCRILQRSSKHIGSGIAAAFVVLLAAGHAQASVVDYTSQSAFDAAVPNAVTFGFNAGGSTTLVSSPYSLNGLSFSSNPTSADFANNGSPLLFLVPVTDTPTYGVDFLTFQNTNVGILAEIDSAGTFAIGFTYGSYLPSGNATVSVNGEDVATIDPTTTAAFIGFTSTSPITSVIFDYPGGFAFDLTGVSTTPLPSTWTMMLLGLAGIGFMAYRRNSKPAQMAA